MCEIGKEISMKLVMLVSVVVNEYLIIVKEVEGIIFFLWLCCICRSCC